MPAPTNGVGYSNQKGFTPKRENLPPTDVSGSYKCGLTGKDIFVPTTVYVRPGHLNQQLFKYTQLGQVLHVSKASWDAENAYLQQQIDQQLANPPAPLEAAQPGRALLPADAVKPVATPVMPEPVRQRGRSSSALVCLNTGRYFATTSAMAIAYGLSNSHIRGVLSGRVPHAKGRTMRAATAQESADYAAGRYQFNGDTVPVSTKGTRKR